jgi:hypothetical protein
MSSLGGNLTDLILGSLIILATIILVCPGGILKV